MAYQATTPLETDFDATRWMVFQRYLKSWFVIDFLATFPFEWAYMIFSLQFISGYKPYLRLNKCLFILRLHYYFYIFFEHFLQHLGHHLHNLVCELCRTAFHLWQCKIARQAGSCSWPKNALQT